MNCNLPICLQKNSYSKYAQDGTTSDLKRHLLRRHENAPGVVEAFVARATLMKKNYGQSLDENPVVHLRSPVWKFAQRLSKTSARCNFCDKMFTLHQASTKELKRHIAKKHADQDGVFDSLVAKENGEIRESETHFNINEKSVDMKIEDDLVN